MTETPILNETTRRLTFWGNSMSVMMRRQAADFTFNEKDKVIFYGTWRKLKKPKEPWLNLVASVAVWPLKERALPGDTMEDSDIDDRGCFQEDLIARTNGFASGTDRHMILISSTDKWMKRQTGLTALVTLLETELPFDTCMDYLNALCSDIVRALKDEDIEVAKAIKKRTYVRRGGPIPYPDFQASLEEDMQAYLERTDAAAAGD